MNKIYKLKSNQMKKLLLVFLVIFGYSLAISQTATIRIGENAGYNIGDTINVELYVDAIDVNVKSWQIYIQFDPAVLTPYSVGGNYYTNFTPPGGTFVSSGIQSGEVSNVLFNFGPAFAVAPGKLMDIPFTYNGGECDVVWGTSKAQDEGGKLVKGQTIIVYDDGSPTGAAITLTAMNGWVKASAGNTWTGAVDTDWFTDGNWSANAYPTISDDVIIPNGLTNYPQVLLDPVLLEVALCNNINIEDAAQIIVGPDGYMSVAGTMTNAGFVGVISDADFSGSLICTDLQGAGDYQYWRWLELGTDPTDPQLGWHYMSSPMAGFGSYNMRDYYLNTWTEATSMWFQHVSPDPAIPCNPAPEIFNNGMEGWSVKWDPDYTTYGCPDPGTLEQVEFVGVYNTGDQTSTITNSGVGLYPGFNLVGNPYPSYWDYDAFWFGPNFPTGDMADAIYYWDEDANQYASYVNGIGNNGGSNIVPPVQGFFFEAIAPSVALTFMQSEQAHVTGLPYYKDEITELVQLQVSANGYTDQTAIHFNAEATTARDLMDARKLFSGGAEIPSLYTVASDGMELSINQLPATDMVPVHFSCPTSGTYTIEVVETSEFQHLVLEDLTTMTQTSLLESSYTFDYTEGSNANRFILHFTPLGTPEFNANSVKIWSDENNIMVQAPNINGDIVVVNLMGQEVVRTDIDPGTNVIPMREVNTYYIVKVISSENAVTGKVYIK